MLLYSDLQLWILNNDPVWQLVKRTVPLSFKALCCKTVVLVGSAVKCHLKYLLASLGRTIIANKFNSQWTQQIPSSHYLSILVRSHFPPEIVPLHRENIYEAAGENQAPFSRSPNRQLLLYSWEVLPRGSRGKPQKLPTLLTFPSDPAFTGSSCGTLYTPGHGPQQQSNLVAINGGN